MASSLISSHSHAGIGQDMGEFGSWTLSKNMKLTWFGGTAARIHIGGEIIVLDPESALSGLNRAEIASGAGRVLSLSGAALPPLDFPNWRPRRPRRLVDELQEEAVEIFRLGANAILIVASGEPHVALIETGDRIESGSWADGATLVLFAVSGSGIEDVGSALAGTRPRFIALAIDEPQLSSAMTVLHEQLGGTDAVLMGLEPEMSVEL